MKTNITLNRSAGTVTVSPLRDLTEELTRWEAKGLATVDFNLKRFGDIRDEILAAAGEVYTYWIQEAGENTERLDQAEPMLAAVIEAVANMTASELGWVENDSQGRITEGTIARLINYYRTGRLPNHAAEERAAETSKPERPAVLNGKWNGKIYGSKRNGFSVYVNGDKIDLTEEQTEEIRNYLADSEAAEARAKAAAATPYTVE